MSQITFSLAIDVIPEAKEGREMRESRHITTYLGVIDCIDDSWWLLLLLLVKCPHETDTTPNPMTTEQYEHGCLLLSLEFAHTYKLCIIMY